MIEVEATEIDNITYVELDKIDIKDVTYVLLVNQDDSHDFCIKKLVVENGIIYYASLDSDKEFDLALMKFTKKHSDLLKS